MDPVVGSIIVAVILLAVIILIIHKLVSDKKKGKFSCGGAPNATAAVQPLSRKRRKANK